MLNFENLDKMLFNSDTQYQVPILEPLADTENIENTTWIPFNYVLSTKEQDKAGKGVHFFIDDYQFIRLWNNPDKYTDKLKGFDYTLTPDFSTYTDMPKALQIYNIYRKQWLGAYWQSLGIKVIPTISWSNPDSYNWIFEGVPKHSIIAISTLGCMKDKRATELFYEGWRKAYKALQPSKILCYGKIPPRLEGNVIEIGNFSDVMAKRINERSK